MIAGTKFGRNYTLTIQTGPSSSNLITITLPFTVEFTVHRNTLSSVNNATIKIYNLAPNTRNQIRKDFAATNTLRVVTLMAGYNGRNTIVFNGNLLEANSVRQGVNFVTTISAQDWSFVFSNVGTSGQQTTSFGPYAPPTTYRQIITDMINLGFQGKVRLGAIGGGYDNPIQRTVSFNGLAADLLYNLTGGSFYIDCGIAYVLDQSEMLPAPAVTVIDADTGLLNTPVLQNQVLTFDMLFEPGIIPGQMLALQSLTDPQRNGTYKVVEIQHSCTISDAVCGDAVTSVGMQNTKVYNGGTVIPLSINSGGPL